MQSNHRTKITAATNAETKTNTKPTAERARRRWLLLALAVLVALTLATPAWADDHHDKDKRGRKWERDRDKEKQEQRIRRRDWKAAPLFWFMVSILEENQGSWRLINEQDNDSQNDRQNDRRKDQRKDRSNEQSNEQANDQQNNQSDDQGFIPVENNDQSSWYFVDESKPGAPVPAGAQVKIGAQAPAGETAAQFAIGSSMEALTLQNLDPSLRGLRFDALERLSYCTFLVDAPLPHAVMLQINIDANLYDDERGWQGRLVFEPYRNGAVLQGEWQCWDTLEGVWYATGEPIAAFANLQSPQPLDAILERFPDLGFHPDFGGLVLRAGDGWTSFEGYVDGVLLSTAQETWLYDFEGPGASRGQLATSDQGAGDGNPGEVQRISLSEKDACKDDGWRAWGFRNQGQCVSYVNYLNNHPAPAAAYSSGGG